MPTNTASRELPTATSENYEFDREKARTISDSIVDAMIKNDRAAVLSKMEKDARDYYDRTSWDNEMDQMFEMYGSPIEANYKKVEQGRKFGLSGDYDKPMLKHWYAVRTTQYDYGSHFIFVEIVPDKEGYASSGVSIVNFFLGDVPEDLQ